MRRRQHDSGGEACVSCRVGPCPHAPRVRTSAIVHVAVATQQSDPPATTSGTRRGIRMQQTQYTLADVATRRGVAKWVHELKSKTAGQAEQLPSHELLTGAASRLPLPRAFLCRGADTVVGFCCRCFAFRVTPSSIWSSPSVKAACWESSEIFTSSSGSPPKQGLRPYTTSRKNAQLRPEVSRNPSRRSGESN
jgi:hypothetical protein